MSLCFFFLIKYHSYKSRLTIHVTQHSMNFNNAIVMIEWSQKLIVLFYLPWSVKKLTKLFTQTKKPNRHWLKCWPAILRFPKHYIFCFVYFRSKIMATASIWMVCHHHPPMCFLNFVRWSTFSARGNNNCLEQKIISVKIVKPRTKI